MGEQSTLRRAASFEEILAARDIDEIDVDVPEWGVSVRVRGISRAAYRRVERLARDEAGVVDADRLDAHLMAVGMIEPAVSFEQALQLVEEKSVMSASQVTRAILAASGLGAMLPEVP